MTNEKTVLTILEVVSMYQDVYENRNFKKLEELKQTKVIHLSTHKEILRKLRDEIKKDIMEEVRYPDRYYAERIMDEKFDAILNRKEEE